MRLGIATLVIRQNPIHLRFQQLRLSFPKPKVSRSKFDPSLILQRELSHLGFLLFRLSNLRVRLR